MSANIDTIFICDEISPVVEERIKVKNQINQTNKYSFLYIFTTSMSNVSISGLVLYHCKGIEEHQPLIEFHRPCNNILQLY